MSAAHGPAARALTSCLVTSFPADLYNLNPAPAPLAPAAAGQAWQNAVEASAAGHPCASSARFTDLRGICPPFVGTLPGWPEKISATSFLPEGRP